MAFVPYHNITGSTGVDVELIAPGLNVGEIRSIVIANTHATADATVTLFLENNPTGAAASIFKIINTLAIPASSSLVIDDTSILSFDNSTDGYGLYITVGSSDTLDVMINR
jgi:hypothetical protein